MTFLTGTGRHRAQIAHFFRGQIGSWRPLEVGLVVGKRLYRIRRRCSSLEVSEPRPALGRDIRHVGPTHAALARSIVVYPCERRAPRPERIDAMPSRRPTFIYRRRFDLAGPLHTSGASGGSSRPRPRPPKISTRCGLNRPRRRRWAAERILWPFLTWPPIIVPVVSVVTASRRRLFARPIVHARRSCPRRRRGRGLRGPRPPFAIASCRSRRPTPGRSGPESWPPRPRPNQRR